MSENSFFDDPREQSQIKAQIVSKYFWAWAKVIIPSQRRRGGRIGYLDLFAGPGRYNDGTESTPLLVLERAISDPDMREMLVSLFNDKDPENVAALSQAIESITGIGSLRFKPRVTGYEVGVDIKREIFEQMGPIPTLLFVDPWGYRGLSLSLIDSALKNWGCDCIIFFNYNRVNMGLHNLSVTEHMNALFGAARAERLRAQLQPMKPDQREVAIIEAMADAMNETSTRYVLPFRFKNANGNRTSHHIIFVSKSIRGYEIMKEIMAGYSSSEQGVPSFEYNPATSSQPLLFELSHPLDELEDMLLDRFADTTITMVDVYHQHHVGKRYVKANYKYALASLEKQGKVKASPSAEERSRRKGQPTFGDDVLVIFPPKDTGGR